WPDFCSMTTRCRLMRSRVLLTNQISPLTSCTLCCERQPMPGMVSTTTMLFGSMPISDPMSSAKTTMLREPNTTSTLLYAAMATTTSLSGQTLVMSIRPEPVPLQSVGSSSALYLIVTP